MPRLYLEDHFHGEDAGEGVIKVIENLVAETALLHRILSGQRDTAQADDDHDEEIKVRQVHHPMGTTPNSETPKKHRWNPIIQFDPIIHSGQFIWISIAASTLEVVSWTYGFVDDMMNMEE